MIWFIYNSLTAVKLTVCRRSCSQLSSCQFVRGEVAWSWSIKHLTMFTEKRLQWSHSIFNKALSEIYVILTYLMHVHLFRNCLPLVLLNTWLQYCHSIDPSSSTFLQLLQNIDVKASRLSCPLLCRKSGCCWLLYVIVTLTLDVMLWGDHMLWQPQTSRTSESFDFNRRSYYIHISTMPDFLLFFSFLLCDNKPCSCYVFASQHPSLGWQELTHKHTEQPGWRLAGAWFCIGILCVPVVLFQYGQHKTWQRNGHIHGKLDLKCSCSRSDAITISDLKTLTGFTAYI